MSNNIQLLKKLLVFIEDYDNKIGNDDIKEFSIFLKDKVISAKVPQSDIAFDENNYQQYKNYMEVEFSTLLTNLYRFAKHYTKKALLGTAIKTIDEFGFLATLLRQKSLLKNELISEHLMETSSGSELLKRLIRNGLVQEFPDKHDKRAKRVSLTEAGIKEIMGAFVEMHKASEIIIGNINQTELIQALAVFNKLNYFHQHIHQQDKNSSLEELQAKYISDS